MCKLSGDFRQERTGMHAIVKLEYNYMQHHTTEGHSLIHNTCFTTKSCKINVLSHQL